MDEMHATAGTRARRARTRLLDAVRESGGATRGQLARRTGMSISSVAATASALLSDGLLVESTPAGGGEARGRRPGVLIAAPPAGHVVGVDIGHRHVAVAVADHRAAVRAERSAGIDVDSRPDATLDLAAHLVGEVVGSTGLPPTGVAEVVACLPTTFDTAHVEPGRRPWEGLDAERELAQRLGRPVRLVNDADAGLAGEIRFGAARGVRDVLYVKVAHGVGAAFQFDGRPYAGSRGLAGEIGHIRVPAAEANATARWCRCGNQGCLETVVCIDEIDRRLAQAGVARAADGLPAPDTVLTRMLIESGRVLGRVLADLCTALNPSVLVLGGDLTAWARDADGSPLVRGVDEALRRYALPATATSLAVRPAELGTRAELMGTLAVALASVGS